jgi:hypothetical protein
MKLFTHTIFKNDDVRKYLTKRQKKQLIKIEAAINKGRRQSGKPVNSYYICNTDEPYAEDVYNAIVHGELVKE